MDVTPLVDRHSQIIQSYASGRFKVSGKGYEGSIVVTPKETRLWNGIDSLDDITEEKLIALFEAADMDVWLLGTGAQAQFLPTEMRKSLKSKGYHIESMDTGAACRTFNVLIAEGRRVSAALLKL